MTWLLTLAGAALLLFALRDLFHTLWHPRGFGTVGRVVFALVWRVARRFDTELAGPLGLLAVAISWTGLVVIGWTLVYLPHMPEQFYFSSSLSPGRSSDLVASAYLSLVTVATLGFGDIIPAHPALRLLVPVQALIGFGLFTAVISWVLQIYPALSRRRALSRKLSIMAQTDTARFVRTGQVPVVTQVLGALIEEVLAVRIDLVQYGETYYFRETDSELSLAANLPYALDLVAAGKDAGSDDVRQLAAMLEEALSDCSVILASYVGRQGSVTETFQAFADDHRQGPVRGT